MPIFCRSAACACFGSEDILQIWEMCWEKQRTHPSTLIEVMEDKKTQKKKLVIEQAGSKDVTIVR